MLQKWIKMSHPQHMFLLMYRLHSRLFGAGKNEKKKKSEPDKNNRNSERSDPSTGVTKHIAE